jgi:hypothetical protein
MKGCSSFSTSDTLNFVTVLTAATATIFFVVGCVGYSDQRAAIKHTCWFSASYSGGLSADFGLSSVYAKDREFLFSFDYGGASCKADFCERCHSDGIAALGLLIAALATAGISALMSAFSLLLSCRTPRSANIECCVYSYFRVSVADRGRKLHERVL